MTDLLEAELAECGLTEAALERIFVEGYDDLVEARGERGGASDAYYRARAASYPDHDGGIGSSKREDIGKGKGRKYPPGFQHIRNALIRQGKSVAEASRIAYGALRRWAQGRGKVKPSTRDKARKVLGQLAAGSGARKAARAAEAAATATVLEAALTIAEDTLTEAWHHRLASTARLRHLWRVHHEHAERYEEEGHHRGAAHHRRRKAEIARELRCRHEPGPWSNTLTHRHR